MVKHLPYYVRCYNRRKKPWRVFKASRRIFGPCLLLGILAVEVIFLLESKAGLPRTFLERVVHVERIERVIQEEEGNGRTERGLSVDLKEGSLRLWRMGESTESMED